MACDGQYSGAQWRKYELCTLSERQTNAGAPAIEELVQARRWAQLRHEGTMRSEILSGSLRTTVDNRNIVYDTLYRYRTNTENCTAKTGPRNPC